MALSSAYVACTAGGKKQTWHFTGVISLEHRLSLNLAGTSSRGADLVNGARNKPDQVTLSVLETDAAHGPGRSARMLEAMNTLKRNRTLCSLVTSLGTYRQMLLTEITATQDGENPEGWTGELVFTEYLPEAETGDTAAKARNNSSTRKYAGTVRLTPFQQQLLKL